MEKPKITVTFLRNNHCIKLATRQTHALRSVFCFSRIEVQCKQSFKREQLFPFYIHSEHKVNNTTHSKETVGRINVPTT